MKFKLNTIENYKNNGWILTKKLFRKSLKEYLKNKNKFGTFGGYNNIPYVTIEKILFEVVDINLETFEVEIKMLNVPIADTFKDILKPENLDLQIYALGCIPKNKRVKNFEIKYFYLSPKDNTESIESR